jgi:zona occludens toxin (predicted ATPase)
MSTNRTPAGRLSPQVYRRRRLVMLLGLLAVIAVIVLIIVRPGASQGDEADPTAPPATTPSAEAAVQETAPPTAIPTEPTAADGGACTEKQIAVEAVTDKIEYATGEQPQLSVTITNTGKNTCVLNAGTKAQVFTISSGSDVYWTSTDCQVDPIDAEVSLTPDTPISSTVPLLWDRTRSSPDTCEGGREAAPAGGASYHLSVSVDGFESDTTKQFLLY